MKVCPVCQTMLFEDMEVCYGCLYHFGSEPALEKARGGACEKPRSAKGSDLRCWAVRLEVRSQSDPDQVWSAELIPPYEDDGPAPAGAMAAPAPRPGRPDGSGASEGVVTGPRR